MSKNEKKTTSGGGKFLNGKGFYIALALCLAVIGVSGYYLYSSINSVTAVPGATEIELGDAYLGDDELPAVSASGGAEVRIEFADETPEEQESAEAVQPRPERSETPVTYSPTFALPVEGEVISAFSGDELMYSETFGDWRSHKGVDIAAEVGEHVLSAAAGTVTGIWDDPLYGTCLSVDHGNSLATIYKGLQSVPTVKVGDYVRAGDCIGAVGTTAIAESGEASHLHLEMTLGGVSVDPMEYLPAKQ